MWVLDEWVLIAWIFLQCKGQVNLRFVDAADCFLTDMIPGEFVARRRSKS